LVRRGTWRVHQVTRPTHHEARERFREACRLDPDLAEAQFWRARVNVGLIAYGWSDDPAADRQEGLEAALRAIYLDERNPYAHYAFAKVCYFSNRLEQAILAAERAIELSPSFALGHFALGVAQLFSGRASDALAPFQRGLKLSPHDPRNASWLKAETPGFASLTAAADAYRGRLKTGFFNEIDVKRTYRDRGRA
jgi:tetratricopeptide (TPR) repeat protein